MTEQKRKVLFVEDDPVDRMALERMIRGKALQYEFKVVACVAEAIHALTTQQFDLIVTDFHLGDGDAIEVVRAAPNIASIITTGTGDQITAVKAIKEGVYEYLVKDPARHYLEILPHTMDSVLFQHSTRMQIKKLEAMYKALSDASPLGIFGTDERGNCNYVNQRYQEISGLTADECAGQGWAGAIHPEDRERVAKEWEVAAKNRVRYESVHRFLSKNGDVRWCDVKAAAVYDNDRITGFVGAVNDITKIKEHEAALERMRTAAEAATYAKSQFLANMSHEIRTPLTSIIGFAEAAKEDGISPAERVKAFETIFSNGKHLLGVINDILDLSKIDAGALKVELLPLSPVAVVENVRTLMVPRLAEKGLSLLVNYKWVLPQSITSDSLRLMQVLVNLVSNALKFTESGHVELSVWCDRKQEKLHFSVTDTGIGMSEEQIERLFQPFSQAEAGTTRKYGGTGLGLSISKQLVNKLGGEISVQSKPNVGSVFSFSIATGTLVDAVWISSIPEKLEGEPASEKITRKLRGRVLIADDAADNRKLLEFTLRKTDLDLTLVENGEEALKKALSDEFDVILLDMQMPIMDGYTAAREIRKNGIKIPIVAFTANTMKHDVLKCIEAGCTTHLPKPFGKDALIECLYQQIRSKRVSETGDGVVISEKFKEDPEALSIVLDFIEGLEGRMRDLSSALDQEDFAKLEDLAHRLSGSAGLYGYPLISELGSLLERSAAGRQLAEAKSLFEQVQDAYNVIQKGVEVMKGNGKKPATFHPTSV